MVPLLHCNRHLKKNYYQFFVSFSNMLKMSDCELTDVQAGFKKGRGTRDRIANIHWIIEKAREFQKNIYFCFIDYAKAFVWITTNCGKF